MSLMLQEHHQTIQKRNQPDVRFSICWEKNKAEVFAHSIVQFKQVLTEISDMPSDTWINVIFGDIQVLFELA